MHDAEYADAIILSSDSYNSDCLTICSLSSSDYDYDSDFITDISTPLGSSLSDFSDAENDSPEVDEESSAQNTGM